MWLQVEPIPAMQVQWAPKIFLFFALCKATVYEADLSVFPKVSSLLLEINTVTLFHGMIFFQASPVSFWSLVITQVRYFTINHQEV